MDLMFSLDNIIILGRTSHSPKWTSKAFDHDINAFPFTVCPRCR